MSETSSGLSKDTQALMAFEASKKSAGVAYLLWFFTGGFGGHRFYLGRTGSAVAQLILSLLGWVLLLAAGFGLLFLIPLGVWLLVDLFLIPGMIQDHNGNLMRRLDASATAHRSVSPVDELGKFAALRDQGAITEHEFQVQKARLLGTEPPVAPSVASA
ncbi:NINE protein [Brevundimonas staleyi]|uniref:NINE protein n=1 Tax=Brevundimonas staleyi TaxID=74326 RepID=A0ABW0FTI8_9CAUL